MLKTGFGLLHLRRVFGKGYHHIEDVPVQKINSDVPLTSASLNSKPNAFGAL